MLQDVCSYFTLEIISLQFLTPSHTLSCIPDHMPYLPPIQTPLHMIKEHGKPTLKILILNNPHSRPHTVIADLIRNPEGWQDRTPFILALRQYPLGGVRREAGNKSKTPTNPLSLDGDLCKTQMNSDNLLRFSICQVGFSYRFPHPRE